MKKLTYRDYLETFFYIANAFIFGSIFRDFLLSGIMAKKLEDLVYLTVIFVIVISVFLLILKSIQLYQKTRNKKTRELRIAITVLSIICIVLIGFQVFSIQNKNISTRALLAAFVFLGLFIGNSASQRLGEGKEE